MLDVEERVEEGDDEDGLDDTMLDELGALDTLELVGGVSDGYTGGKTTEEVEDNAELVELAELLTPPLEIDTELELEVEVEL